MGTTDIGGSTARIVDRVLAAAPGCAIDVVLGPEAESLQHVRELAERNHAIAVQVDSRDMARLMREADLAIGAAGSTSWERCCLGLPTIALVLAENQRPSANALSNSGAALIVDDAGKIGPALQQLLAHPDRLAQMSAAGFAIADGAGTARTVVSMLDDNAPRGALELRPAALGDAELVWLWRNDPATRAQSRTTAPIAWQDHIGWFTRALSDPGRRLIIAERNGLPVGMVRFDPADADDGFQVSIAVGPDARASGVGSALLQAGCALFPGARIHAFLRSGNEPSRRLFEACGFQPQESAEPGFLRYMLSDQDRNAVRRKHA
jgi:RimJ/RimL family protein N-acetyltransferase